ncbi:MAG: hypothetical protein ACOX7R_09585 [Acetivibrionales bacterium]
MKALENIITEMHSELDNLISETDFDLQNVKVQEYSRRLDRILGIYMKKKKSIEEKEE